MPRTSRSMRAVISVLAVAAACVAAIALWPLAVDGWLVLRLRSDREAVWRPAAERLVTGGRGFGIRAAAAKVLDADPEHFPIFLANVLLERCGPRARLALPAYRAALLGGRKESRRAALQVLRDRAWRVPEAVDVLREALGSDDRVVRWQAAYVLGEMGTVAGPAGPDLVRALGDREKDVRWAAAGALVSVGPDDREAVPALARALADPSDLVAGEAARSLAAFGPRAAPAVPDLVRAVRGRDPVRGEAAAALESIGRPARAAIPDLAAAMDEGGWEAPRYVVFSGGAGLGEEIPVREDGSSNLGWREAGPPPDLRSSGVEALLALGADPAGLVPVLRRLLAAPDHWLRQSAARAIGLAGPAAVAAVPDIVAALEDRASPSEGVLPDASLGNEAAAEALARIGPAAEPALVAALRSEKPRARAGAALALGAMEAPSEAARRALESAGADRDRDVRLAASLALHRIDPSRDIVPALLEADPHGMPWPRPWTSIGKEGEASLPLLADAAKDEKKAPVALAILAEIGRKSGDVRRVLPILLEALGSPEKTIRDGAVTSLAHLGSASREAAGAFVARFRDDPEVRRTALGLPGILGPSLRAAAPVLEDLLRRGDRDDARAILDALAAIAPDDPRVVRLVLRAIGPRDASPAPFLLDRLLEMDDLPAPVRDEVARELSASSDLRIRVKAARLLGKLGARPAGAIDIFRAGLREPSPSSGRLFFSAWRRAGFRWRSSFPTGRDAARGLAEMGPAARDAAPDLEGGLDRPDPELRALAAIALWRTAGRRRLEPLAEAVDEAAREPLPLYGPPETLPPSFGPAREAAAVLAEMGPAAAEALPALARAIASPGARAIRADLERAAARLRS